jgi:hypothetical protein
VPAVTVRTSDQITQMQRSLVHAAKHLQPAGQGVTLTACQRGAFKKLFSFQKTTLQRLPRTKDFLDPSEPMRAAAGGDARRLSHSSAEHPAWPDLYIAVGEAQTTIDDRGHLHAQIAVPVGREWPSSRPHA